MRLAEACQRQLLTAFQVCRILPIKKKLENSMSSTAFKMSELTEAAK